MLDRNLQSHLRLGLLLSLLSSSILLQSRLVPDPSDTDSKHPPAVVAYVLFGASMLTFIAGLWEFETGLRDLLNLTAFLRSAKYILVPNPVFRN